MAKSHGDGDLIADATAEGTSDAFRGTIEYFLK
jgi:hypothetical protein